MYGEKRIDSIYRAMWQYKDRWLDASYSNLGSGSWGFEPVSNIHNGIENSLVWSTGGGCVGHGQQGSNSLTAGQRKIYIYDIADNNRYETYDWLAYSMLYSIQHDEHTTTSPPSTLGQSGKETIANWLYKNKGSNVHAQIEENAV